MDQVLNKCRNASGGNLSMLINILQMNRILKDHGFQGTRIILNTFDQGLDLNFHFSRDLMYVFDAVTLVGSELSTIITDDHLATQTVKFEAFLMFLASDFIGWFL